MTERRLHRYTYADYVGVELDTPHRKHEFLDGEIYAMSGGTLDHATFAGRHRGTRSVGRSALFA